jgi:hypothetical protein
MKRNLFFRFLARLRIGRKLLLIYLLDLSAVLYIRGILIHEKYIAIDFSDKKLIGNATSRPCMTRSSTLPLRGPGSNKWS